LLDSHVILWWVTAPSKIKSDAMKALIADDNELFASAASWWELAIKRAIGRLRFDADQVLLKLDEGEVNRLDVTFGDAEISAGLAKHHNDPFDRMLAAQALTNGLAVMTRDKSFDEYGVPVIRA
jgi:PIN domain nuclease of toxin-antitoxin system